MDNIEFSNMVFIWSRGLCVSEDVSCYMLRLSTQVNKGHR